MKHKIGIEAVCGNCNPHVEIDSDHDLIMGLDDKAAIDLWWSLFHWLYEEEDPPLVTGVHTLTLQHENGLMFVIVQEDCEIGSIWNIK